MQSKMTSQNSKTIKNKKLGFNYTTLLLNFITPNFLASNLVLHSCAAQWCPRIGKKLEIQRQNEGREKKLGLNYAENFRALIGASTLTETMCLKDECSFSFPFAIPSYNFPSKSKRTL
uniref:Udg protein n=1 Tax=Fopius arisanus TaxID=64838 RepID=A0A0C9RB72_9HYME